MSVLNNQNGEEYQNIFEYAVEGIFQSSMEGRFLKVNSAMARIYGYASPDEMVMKIKQISKQIYVDSEGRNRFLEALQTTDHIEKFQAKNYRKDGSIIWTQTNARVVRDSEDNALFIEGFVTDITSLKETEFALAENKERYRTLVEELPMAVFLDTADEAQTTLYISPKIEKLLGYTPEEWMADPSVWDNSLHPDDKERVLSEDVRTNINRKNFSTEYRLRKKDGTYTWIHEEASLILDVNEEPLYWQGFLSDISEQKWAEESLQRSGEQFKKIFQAIPLASCIATLKEGKYIAANDAYWKLSGFKPSEFLGHTSRELGFLDEQKRNQFVARLKKEKSIHNEDGKLITKNGEIRTTLEFFDLIVIDNQDCILGMFHDITDKVNAQKALQASDERFRLSFLTSPDAININRLDDGLFIDINEGFTAITGYTREDTVGKASSDIDIWYHASDRTKLITELKKNSQVNNLEAKFKLKDGRIVTGLMSARVIMLNEVPHIISITREIETIKRAEETLQRQLQELIILHTISTAASSSKNMDELLQRTTDIIADALIPTNCGIELVSENGKTFQAHPSYRGAFKKEISTPMSISYGVTGKAIRTGASIRLGNVADEPEYIEITKGIQSELCVPIKIQERVIGIINIESKKADAFDEADERLFNTIAGTLATSIEQLRLLETSQRRLQELSILSTVALTATRATAVDELIENITQIIGDSLYPDNFGVLLLNEDGTALYPHLSYRGITSEKFPTSVPIDQGVSGLVATSGKPQRIANVRNHPNYIEVTSQVRSELCVPILLGERILGVINTESVQIDLFTEDDERLLATIASTLATALEKLRLLDQETKRREEAEILREATTALTTSLDLPTLLDAILENLFKIVPYDSASIAIQRNGANYIVAGRGFPDDYEVVGKQLTYSDKWLSTDSSQRVFIIPDVHLEPNFKKWEGTEYIRAWMGVPMLLHSKLIGFLNLDSQKPNFFTEKDATLIQTFASSAAVAIENARLFEAEQRRHREAETLRQAALAITTSLELASVLETILIVMKQVVPYDSASVLLLEEDKLYVTAAQGFSKSDEILDKEILASNGLFKQIRESDVPVIIKDARLDERFKTWLNLDYVRGWMGVALILRNEVIGCIALDSLSADSYTETLASLSQAFANQAASAIQNARQFENEQRHFQEAETLRQTAEELSSTLEVQQVLVSTLDNLNQVIPFDGASIFLVENDKLRLTAAKGILYTNRYVGQLFPVQNALMQEIMSTRFPLILDDAQNDHRYEKWGETSQVRGWMGAPLISRGIIIGFLTVDSLKVGTYSEHSATLVATFAHQVAAAIENARLYERGEQQIRQLTVLRDIDSAISSSFDLRVTLNLLIGHIIRELDVDAVAILLYNPDTQALSLYTSSGLTLKRNTSLSYVRIGESLAGQVALQRKSLQVPNLNDSTSNVEYLKNIEESFTSYFGFPLIGKGQIKGVLEIYTEDEIGPSPDWLNFLQILAGQAAIAIDNVQMFKNLQRSNQELILAYDITLEGWGRALELRDKETQGHTNRVVELTIELARRIGVAGENLTHIMRGALLHDVGKLGIPDSILQKPGPLTEAEWEVMRQHPQYAYDLIYPIIYLRPALDIPYSHHERWDGSGYPRGLKGENIPLAARIFAVVDIWDALLYERVYREAWPENKVIQYLKNTAGIELDPAIVECFLEILEEERSKNRAD